MIKGKELEILNLLNYDTPFKIIVTPKESEEVQRLCFRKGVYWEGRSGNEVCNQDQRYLLISPSTSRKGNSITFFLTHSGWNFQNAVEVKLFPKSNPPCSFVKGKKVSFQEGVQSLLRGETIFVGDEIIKMEGGKTFYFSKEWVEEEVSFNELSSHTIFLAVENRSITISYVELQEWLEDLRNVRGGHLEQKIMDALGDSI